ncbi:MAG: M23 family metallopeptidase [Acidobacteria bacterium]|nr:M23 family metallopeptidase [Acidobacteriota bacterium]
MAELELFILPKTLYVESIQRGDQRFERFLFHLIVRNRRPESITADSLEVVLQNPALGAKLSQVFQGDLLEQRFRQSQKMIDESAADGLVIASDKMRGIVGQRLEVEGDWQFLEVACRFKGHCASGVVIEQLAQRRLHRDAPRTKFSLPLRGRWWIAGGHDNFEPHARSFLNALTYAYDFIQIGESGKSYRNAGQRNEDYYAYSQAVLAAADGKIVQALDGIAENRPSQTPEKNPQVYLQPEAIPMTGNTVVIEHGENEYSCYAHLQPALLVQVGEAVKRGQRLGRVGNSGESTEPHLHFHLADGANLAQANGIPVAFSNWFEDAFSIAPTRVEEGILLSREFVESVD